MRLLLDTHVALWAVLRAPRLSDRVAAMIEDPANEVAVSMVSFWEIAIKNRPGRRDSMPITLADAVREFAAADFATVPIGLSHLNALADLPGVHGDPFDRLLVATAIADTWRLVSADRAVARYGDVVIPA